MYRRVFGFIVFSILFCFSPVLHAAIYPLEIFTNNGAYFDSPDLDFYVDVVDVLANQVDFTFYNDSLVSSAIASIYYDDDSLLGAATINNGPGTLFNQYAKPGNLPAGKTLEPSFTTAGGLSFDSEPAPPKNGINPGEWVRITFDLINGGTFESLINKLNAGQIRMGTHIIALPDGSSESSVNVPEPAAFCLLAAGAFSFLHLRIFLSWACRNRRKSRRRPFGTPTPC